MRRVNRRVLEAILMAVTLSFLAVSVVQAHASLVRSDPPDNSSAPSSLRNIRLWFSEKIDPQFSSVQVWDSQNQPVKPVNFRVDPAEPDLMEIQVPQLANGIYTVDWKAFSAYDGHITHGLLVIGVGVQVSLKSSTIVQSDSLPGAPDILATWLNYLTVLGLVGGVAIALLVLPYPEDSPIPQSASSSVALGEKEESKALQSLRGQAHLRLLKWLRFLCLSAFMVGIFMLVLQAINVSSSSSLAISSPGTFLQLIGQSRWGILWLARQATLIVFIGLIYFILSSKNNSRGYRISRLSSLPVRRFPTLTLKMRSLAYFLLIPVSVALVVELALNSHAAGLISGAAFAVTVDAFHLIAASFWVGGLAGMIAGFYPYFRHDWVRLQALVRTTWSPFSRMAALSVSMVTITGLFSASFQAASIDALLTTTYGHALLIKTCLFLAVGFLGLLNSILLHPKLASPLAALLHRPTGWTPLSIRRQPGLFVAEISLGVFLLGAAAILTNSSPARGPQFLPSEDIPTSVTYEANDLWVTFFAKPNQPGLNVLTFQVVSSVRPALAPIQQVLVTINGAGQKNQIGPLQAKPIDTGLYQVDGNYFNQSGDWQISVTIKRTGLPDAVTLLPWTVAPAGGPRPIIISDQPLEPVLPLLAIILLAAVVSAVVITRPHRNKQTAPSLDAPADINQYPELNIPAFTKNRKQS